MLQKGLGGYDTVAFRCLAYPAAEVFIQSIHSHCSLAFMQITDLALATQSVYFMFIACSTILLEHS